MDAEKTAKEIVTKLLDDLPKERKEAVVVAIEDALREYGTWYAEFLQME